MQSGLSSVGVSCSVISEVSNNGGKYGPKEVHIEHWVQAKEWWSVELKSIVTHNLGDGVRPIEKWVELLMGPCKMLLLQV
jgi:hypothetical protein